MSRTTITCPDTLVSSVEACHLTDATYRMLDYWCRTGIITPAIEARGSGSHRRFTLDQIVLLRAVYVMARHGAQRDAMRALVMAVAANPDLRESWVVVAMDDDDTFDVFPPNANAGSGWLVDMVACRDWVDARLADQDDPSEIHYPA